VTADDLRRFSKRLGLAVRFILESLLDQFEAAAAARRPDPEPLKTHLESRGIAARYSCSHVFRPDGRLWTAPGGTARPGPDASHRTKIAIRPGGPSTRTEPTVSNEEQVVDRVARPGREARAETCR
jgi:hypothetical protein